jgi:hypothetical protein
MLWARAGDLRAWRNAPEQIAATFRAVTGGGPHQLTSGTRHRRYRCSLPGLTGFATGRRGETGASHHQGSQLKLLSWRSDWRRGWDSNPRTPVKMLLEFQSSAFDRSATSPINNLRSLSRSNRASRPTQRKARPVTQMIHGRCCCRGGFSGSTARPNGYLMPRDAWPSA